MSCLTPRELSSVGVGGSRSEAGYYYMPDFEVIRAGLKSKGWTTGDQMSSAMLEEANIGVSGIISWILLFFYSYRPYSLYS